MKYINPTRVHPALAAAVKYVPPEVREEDFRVTELCRPPLMAYLEMIHDDEIVVDVGQRMDLLDGVSVHEALARADVSDALQEERMYIDIAGFRISGKCDWYSRGIIADFKRCKVAASYRPTRTEYVMQLNFYAVLLRSYGFEVRGLEEVQIYKDWSKLQVGTSTDYPRAGTSRRKVELWTDEEARKMMRARIAKHQAARKGNPEICTLGERWARPDAFAVMKPKGKRAVAVFGPEHKRGGGEEEALALAADTPALKLRVETRKGDQWVRCRDWCDVASWCPEYGKVRA